MIYKKNINVILRMNTEYINFEDLNCLDNKCVKINNLDLCLPYEVIYRYFKIEIKRILISEGNICDNCLEYLRRKLKLLKIRSKINNECFADVWDLEKKLEFLFN
jgi:hypothetical protein